MKSVFTRQGLSRALRRPFASWPAMRLAAAVVLVVAVFGGGWLAATLVESPAQREAAATAPEALPVTAAVERGDLAAETTAQATVARESSVTALVQVPAGDSAAFVTAVLVEAGGEVGSLQPIVAVNDRPTFAMAGKIPSYRDLVEGSRGSDVGQLQDALVEAGYTIPDKESKTFGEATRAAVLDLYATTGFWPIVSRDGMNVAISPKAVSADDTVVVPESELLIVDLTLPATVDSVPSVGDPVDGSSTTVSVSSGELAAVATLPDALLAQVQTGLAGTLGSYTDSPVAVTISEVDLGDTENGVSGSVLLIPDEGQEIPEEWYGTEVVATLILQTVATDALIVPVRALATDASGASSVQLMAADGDSIQTVVVSVLGEMNGLAAIEPTAEDLAAGDQVVVG